MNRGEIFYPQDEGRLARGVIYLLLSQAFFVLSLYLLHATLARVFTPAEYGLFSVVMTILTWVEIATNDGVPPAVQKYLAEDTRVLSSLRRVGLKLQALIAISIFSGLFLLSPFLSLLFGDQTLTFYIRISSLDIPLFALFAVFRGVLNGFQAFAEQAWTTIVYSLAKLGGVCLLVIAGFSIGGALVGNAIASLVGLLLALGLSRSLTLPSGEMERKGRYDYKKVLGFALPTLFLSLANNLVLNMDLFSVKALIRDGSQVGFYAAAYNLANVPRFVLLALSFVLLPSLSKTLANRDKKRAEGYIRQVLRFLALLLLPSIVIVNATSDPLVRLIYSAIYSPAVPFLKVLILSISLHVVYFTLVTVILAEGRPRLAFGISAFLIPLSLLANWKLITLYGALGGAYASLLSHLAGTLIVGVYVLKRFKRALDFSSLLRVLAASTVVYLLARLYFASGIMIIPNYLVLFAIYFLLLHLFGEIKREDLSLLMAK